MNNRLCPRYRVGALVMAFLLHVAVAGSFAQAQEKSGAWTVTRNDANRLQVWHRVIELTPAGPERPTLKRQFIEADYNRIAGNSALFYLKAMGFFEQNNARHLLTEFHRKQQTEGDPSAKKPPYSWLDLSPDDLPLEEVREFLTLTSFQPRMLAEATKRRDFSLDRNLSDASSVIGYLLPEIQQFREAARMQSLRCRVAIAEDRIDDALAIYGQQLAMANHLSQDEFLVSNLVAAAIWHIAWEDALHLMQHPETPNLYWALAALPDPLVETQFGLEEQFLFEEFKQLRLVDATPRSSAYWREMVRDIAERLCGLDIEGIKVGGRGPDAQYAAVAQFIAEGYLDARRYVLETGRLDAEQVERLPATQVFLLAVCWFYEEASDDLHKWRHVPYHQALKMPSFLKADEVFKKRVEEVGPAGQVAAAFLPGMRSLLDARARTRMQLALLQSIEAIRSYAAGHDGQLPPALEACELPPPMDVSTGRLVEYEYLGDSAILTIKAMHLHNRVEVRIR